MRFADLNAQKTVVRNRRQVNDTITYERRRGLALQVDDPNGDDIERDFDPPDGSGFFFSRNLTRFCNKRGIDADYTYFPASASEPDYVADNLQTIIRRGGDEPG